jgi:hypothetical protein
MTPPAGHAAGSHSPQYKPIAFIWSLFPPAVPSEVDRWLEHIGFAPIKRRILIHDLMSKAARRGGLTITQATRPGVLRLCARLIRVRNPDCAAILVVARNDV